MRESKYRVVGLAGLPVHWSQPRCWVNRIRCPGIANVRNTRTPRPCDRSLPAGIRGHKMQYASVSCGADRQAVAGQGCTACKGKLSVRRVDWVRCISHPIRSSGEETLDIQTLCVCDPSERHIRCWIEESIWCAQLSAWCDRSIHGSRTETDFSSRSTRRHCESPD